MNRPGGVQTFKHGQRSHRELPLRLAEFGNVHRYEPSSASHGRMRVRGFTQDDAHILRSEDQIAEECLKINDLILSTNKGFGFGQIVVKPSKQPEQRVESEIPGREVCIQSSCSVLTLAASAPKSCPHLTH